MRPIRRLAVAVMLVTLGLAPAAGLTAAQAAGVSTPAAAKTYGCGTGQWPWNNEPWYLNRFVDPTSGTGYCIAPNQFTGVFTFQPDGSNTVYMEADVDVAAGATATLPAGATWLGGPHTLTVDGDLEMSAGTTMEMSQGNGVYGVIVNGKLDANGVPGATPGSGTPVTFTAVNASSGGLQYGIAFQAGSSGTLNDAVIEAGGDGFGCPGIGVGGLVDVCLGSSDAQPPIIENSLIECGPTGQGCGNGVEVVSGSPVLKNDAFNNLGWFAVEFDSPPTSINMIGLSATNDKGDFLGGDVVLVSGGNGSYSGTGTWTVTGIPTMVRFGDLTVPAGAQLTLAAGMDYEGPDGIAVQGTLNVSGTSTQPVTVDTPGVAFIYRSTNFSAGASGTWTYAQINSGGDDISLSGGSVNVSHSTFSIGYGSAGVEVAAGSPTGPALSADTFAVNDGQEPIQYDGPPTNMPATSFTLKLGTTGHPTPYIVLYNRPYTGTGTWARQSVPILTNNNYTNNITIPPGSALTIDGGNTIGSGCCTLFDVQGVLNMKGTPRLPVRLMAINAPSWSPNGAPNILFEAGSSGFIIGLDDLYAGGGGSGTPGCIPAPGGGTEADAAINICGANPVILDSTFQSGASNDVSINGGHPVFHDDSFLGVPGGDYGVYNYGWTSGQTLINATQNWWGDSSGPSGVGSGSGTPVSTGVAFTPWLSLTISPTTGAAGSAATVSGAGFKPGERVIVLWICGSASCSTRTTLLTQVTANATGSFQNVAVTVPASATAGTYIVAAFGSASLGYAVAPFTVS